PGNDHMAVTFFHGALPRPVEGGAAAGERDGEGDFPALVAGDRQYRQRRALLDRAGRSVGRAGSAAPVVVLAIGKSRRASTPARPPSMPPPITTELRQEQHRR